MPRRPAPATPSAPPAEGDGKVVPVRRTRKVAPVEDGAPAAAPAARAPKPAPAARAPRPPSPAGAKARTAKIAPAGALPPARIPPEALKAPRNDRRLAWTLGISIALHVAVLSIHFAPIVIRDLGRGPPLEVALVNAKTKEKPVKADVLAQANLDGGGNTDQNRRARSPLPVLQKDSPQNEITAATRKLEQLERDAREILTRMQANPLAPIAPPRPEVEPQPEPPPPELPTAKEMMQRTLEAMRLEAQIAKDMDAYQKRPKRRFVGARAEEYRFARYVEDWRLKVERIGNLNYPEAARQKKLYGSLLLTVSIRADGSLENVEINRSSGHRILDAAATKIVEMAAPYAAFPPDIKRDTDILHITRTWTFAKGDALTSQ